MGEQKKPTEIYLYFLYNNLLFTKISDEICIFYFFTNFTIFSNFHQKSKLFLSPLFTIPTIIHHSRPSFTIPPIIHYLTNHSSPFPPIIHYLTNHSSSFPPIIYHSIILHYSRHHSHSSFIILLPTLYYLSYKIISN